MKSTISCWNILIVCIAIIVGGLYYMNIFYHVEWNKDKWNGITGICIEHVGHYKDIGPIFEFVYQRIGIQDITTITSFGIYLDDPAMKPENEWKSYACVVVTDDNKEKVSQGDVKDNNKELFYVTIPVHEQVLQSTYPLVNSLSIMIGLFKVYPALDTYCKQTNYKHGPIVEIYNRKQGIIHYLAIPENMELETKGNSNRNDNTN